MISKFWVAQRMDNIKKIFWKTIIILKKSGVLEHVVLIGSWVEYIYERSNYLKEFEANLKTKDIDFLIKNIHKPREGVDIVDILEKEGYAIDIDYISGAYKFYKGKDLEIEFLVKEIGKGQIKPYKVPSFGIKAEGLRYMDLLLDNTITINIENIDIAVPSPQAYLLQKIIINDQRKNKAGKDYLGIENLLDNIKRSDTQYQELGKLYNSLTKKRRNKIDKFLNINLFDLLE